MDEDVEIACVECAHALTGRFDPLLVERVQSQIWGGAAYGEPGHMDGLLSDGAAVAQVLIGLISLLVSVRQLVITRRPDDSKPSIHFTGDIDDVKRSFELKIEDLGTGDQETARIVVAEVCDWLRSSQKP